MLYKTETHAHSKVISKCSHASEDDIIRRYTQAGYQTLVLTNHLCTDTFSERKDAPWEEKAEYFLSGYTSLKEKAKGYLHILLGMELRFSGTANDYLVYGFDESFLRKNGDITTLGLSAFSKLAKENGLLLFQAHPFRYGITVVNPCYLDGVEVYNGHAGHESNNEIALAWAEKHRLKKLSGSDFHDPDSRTTGGIFTEVPLTDMNGLMSVLREETYTLNRGE
jgi:PHP domain.